MTGPARGPATFFDPAYGRDFITMSAQPAPGSRCGASCGPAAPGVRVLHVGSYDDEGPTIARMHDEFMPAEGLAPRGRHHEIYLSDARRTDPSRLRAILRQPVSPAHA
ncbi:MAG TPA: GyrI-like domain-containing protein [Trebonia sp.]|nr:GyrI-like domain-containing protein [Trebonia sp.]